MSKREYKGVKIRSTTRRRIYRRDAWQCLYCLNGFGGYSPDLSLDHLRPQSKGGSNRPTNLATACIPCNSSLKDLIGAAFDAWIIKKLGQDPAEVRHRKALWAARVLPPLDPRDVAYFEELKMRKLGKSGMVQNAVAVHYDEVLARIKRSLDQSDLEAALVDLEGLADLVADHLKLRDEVES